MSADSSSPVSDAVGSLAEEVAKLFGALAAARASGAVADDPASAHTPPECAYCPICQAIGFVRQSHPEVIEHLSASVSSLVMAARELLDAAAAHDAHDAHEEAHDDSGVERIDLGQDETWD